VLDGEDGVGNGDVREAKRVKTDGGEEDEEEMEIEMEDDEDALPKANGSAGSTLVCTNLPPECSEDIMGALFGQYPGFSKASLLPSSAPAPSSHPPSNPGAKSFSITFGSKAQAEAALGATKGFLMQPGWEMGVSLQ